MNAPLRSDRIEATPVDEPFPKTAGFRKVANDGYVGSTETTLLSAIFGSSHSRDKSVSYEDDMSGVSREEIDAKIDRSEARIEAAEARINASLDKISAEVSRSNTEIRSEISAVRAELQHKPGTWTIVGAAFTSAVAVVGILIGFLSYGGDRFDGGVQVTSVSVQQAADAKRIAEETGQKVDALIQRLDAVLNKEEPTQPRLAPAPN